MIYLTSTTELQEILIPNVYGFDTTAQDTRLLILSTVDLVEFEREYRTGASFIAGSFSEAFRIGYAAPSSLTADGQYVILKVIFNQEPVIGSFEYRLLQGDMLVGSGCCQVGEYGEEEDIYEPDITNYDKTIQYGQYN